jgi:alpha-ketoglutarate-dependent taurine dioxygenase
MGTRLTDVDLQTLSEAELSDVRQALLQHAVIVLPQTHRLQPEVVYTFAQRLASAGPGATDLPAHLVGERGGIQPPAWGTNPVSFDLTKRHFGLVPLTNHVDASGKPAGAHKFGWGW